MPTYNPKNVAIPNLTGGMAAMVASMNSRNRSGQDFITALDDTVKKRTLEQSTNIASAKEGTTADLINQIRDGKTPDTTGLMYNGQEVGDAEFEYDKHKLTEGRAAQKATMDKAIYDKRMATDNGAYYTHVPGEGGGSTSTIDWGAHFRGEPQPTKPVVPVVGEGEKPTALNNVLNNEETVHQVPEVSVASYNNPGVKVKAGVPTVKENPITKSEQKSKDILSGVISKEDYLKETENVKRGVGASELNYDATMKVFGDVMNQHQEKFKGTRVRKEQIATRVQELDQEMYRIDSIMPPAGATNKDIKSMQAYKEILKAKFLGERSKLVAEDGKLNKDISSEASNIQKAQDGQLSKMADGVSGMIFDPNISQTTKMEAISEMAGRMSKLPGLTKTSIEKKNAIQAKLLDQMKKVASQSSVASGTGLDKAFGGMKVDSESAMSGSIVESMSPASKNKVAIAYDKYVEYAAQNDIPMPTKKSWDSAILQLGTDNFGVFGGNDVIDIDDKTWFGLGEPTVELETDPDGLLEAMKPLLAKHRNLKTTRAKGRSERLKKLNESDRKAKQLEYDKEAKKKRELEIIAREARKTKNKKK